MSKFAWVEDGKIRDICHGNPDELYTPEVARFYKEQVPSEASPGDLWDGKTVIKPIVPKPVPVPVVPGKPIPRPLEFREGEEGLRALLNNLLEAGRRY